MLLNIHNNLVQLCQITKGGSSACVNKNGQLIGVAHLSGVERLDPVFIGLLAEDIYQIFNLTTDEK